MIDYKVAIRFYVFNWSGLTVKKVYSDIRPMEYTDEIRNPKRQYIISLNTILGGITVGKNTYRGK